MGVIGSFLEAYKSASLRSITEKMKEKVGKDRTLSKHPETLCGLINKIQEQTKDYVFCNGEVFFLDRAS